MKKESISTPSRREKFIREIEILQSLDHRYIVKLWEVIETNGYIGMVMEYASGKLRLALATIRGAQRRGWNVYSVSRLCRDTYKAVIA